MEYLIGFLVGVVLGIVLTLIKTEKQTSDDWDTLDEEENKGFTIISEEKFFKCEECGGVDFYEGPGGGSFGNLECANSKCKTKYNNLGPFGIKRIK